MTSPIVDELIITWNVCELFIICCILSPSLWNILCVTAMPAVPGQFKLAFLNYNDMAFNELIKG